MHVLTHLRNEYNLTNPNFGHTTGGTGRVGAELRMAGPEGTSTVLFAQNSSVLRAHQGTGNNFPERLFGSTNSYSKPKEAQNLWLTTRSSAFDNPLISGTASALRSWLLFSVTMPTCLCEVFWPRYDKEWSFFSSQDDDVSCRRIEPSIAGASRWLGALFPGHALHEKGLQRRKGVVPLVGSQEQRALLAPLINR